MPVGVLLTVQKRQIRVPRYSSFSSCFFVLLSRSPSYNNRPATDHNKKNNNNNNNNNNNINKQQQQQTTNTNQPTSKEGKAQQSRQKQVAAATATATTTSMSDSKRRELLALDTQKKSLQSEAEAIISELTAELPDGVSRIVFSFVDADLMWMFT